MRQINRCRRCGAKYANKDEAIWHFWSEHRSLIKTRAKSLLAGIMLIVVGALVLGRASGTPSMAVAFVFMLAGVLAPILTWRFT